MPKIKIALLSGGISGEREVSLKTGEQIYNALDKNKYEIFKYDPLTPGPSPTPASSPRLRSGQARERGDLKNFINDAIDKKFDLVIPALHGPYGEDGKLQGMLDMIGVPYLFSGCLASALAMDKKKSKIIAKDSGLNVANDIVLDKNDDFNVDEIVKKLSLPLFIKPINLGSSVGMSMAKTKEELTQGIELAFKHDNRILIEQFISGRELTVPIMGTPSLKLRSASQPEALPIIEIKPKVSDWFNFEAKYEVGGTEEICPAKIPEDIKNKIGEMGVKIFKAIGCKDLARVDFIWSADDNKLYFLEINTIPGMTETSLVPQSAKVAGMEFGEFLDKLIGGVIK